uniref:Uncharacterized protein n=1 Tax=Rhizophora mucronata TaxID=61149 RepID=A0A2P2Q2R1_RHIMU
MHCQKIYHSSNRHQERKRNKSNKKE